MLPVASSFAGRRPLRLPSCRRLLGEGASAAAKTAPKPKSIAWEPPKASALAVRGARRPALALARRPKACGRGGGNPSVSPISRHAAACNGTRVATAAEGAAVAGEAARAAEGKDEAGGAPGVRDRCSL